jgi:hypothetical protein
MMAITTVWNTLLDSMRLSWAKLLAGFMSMDISTAPGELKRGNSKATEPVVVGL